MQVVPKSTARNVYPRFEVAIEGIPGRNGWFFVDITKFEQDSKTQEILFREIKVSHQMTELGIVQVLHDLLTESTTLVSANYLELQRILCI